MVRFKETYQREIVPKLVEQFGFKNIMQVPRLKKIVVNMGVGGAVQDRKLLDSALAEMTLITGQKPVITKARKSIAGFKLRAGMPIGCRVTLRRDRMYEFLDRFISFALPRVRDFKGVSSKAFDRRGNCMIGIKEQIIFPEIEYDKVDTVRGLSIAIVTTATTDQEARVLLRGFKMPFGN